MRALNKHIPIDAPAPPARGLWRDPASSPESLEVGDRGNRRRRKVAGLGKDFEPDSQIVADVS